MSKYTLYNQQDAAIAELTRKNRVLGAKVSDLEDSLDMVRDMAHYWKRKHGELATENERLETCNKTAEQQEAAWESAYREERRLHDKTKELLGRAMSLVFPLV